MRALQRFYIEPLRRQAEVGARQLPWGTNALLSAQECAEMFGFVDEILAFNVAFLRRISEVCVPPRATTPQRMCSARP